MAAAESFGPGEREYEALLARVRSRSIGRRAESTCRALLPRLQVQPHDRVLELGVGSGRLLFAVAVRASAGFVAGVDPEEYALRHAQRRCERLVREGRVSLVQGTSLDLSMFSAESFDKVYGVHVCHFWEDPLPHLREARRVLRPGGTLLLGASDGPPDARFTAALRTAGFERHESESADELTWTLAR